MGRMMDRRGFLSGAACSGVATMLGGCALPWGSGADGRVPYGDTIGDRLWMWGHHRDSFKALKGRRENYNLPYETRIDMAEACRRMNIPGCFVVRWTDNPKAEDLPEYMKQFRDTKRVGFSITDSASGTFLDKVRLGFEYADKMPNLTSFVMDDFWSGAAKGVDLKLISSIRDGLLARNMRLGIVLYADANGIKGEYKDVLDLCDEITFWFWHGKNVGTITAQVAKLRDLVGTAKPVLLGQYMYDFGGKKPMSGTSMETQLMQAGHLLDTRAIDGVIFHCTPLVDMDLEAVRVSRDWIRANAGRAWGRG